MSIIMSGHETCKNGSKIRKKMLLSLEMYFVIKCTPKVKEKHINKHQRGEIEKISQKLDKVKISIN